MTPYRDRLVAGEYQGEGSAAVAEEPAALPRTHAELDELAAGQGHEWSGEELTVAEKQAELNG